MKKILYIITQSNFGGAQRFIFNMATELDKTKYQVMVAAGPQGDDENGLLRNLEKEGVLTHHLKHLYWEVNPRREVKAFKEMRKLIKEFRPDVVQLGSSKAGVLGSFAARSFRYKNGAGPKRPKVIYRIGGFSFLQADRWSLTKRLIYFWAEKLSRCCRDVLVLNSNYEKETAIKKGLSRPERTRVIHNGVKLKKLDFLNRETARSVLQKLIGKNCAAEEMAGKKIIGTVAHFYPYKDLPTLVQAAGKVLKKRQDVCFILIGDGLERTAIAKEIETLGLEKSVFLPGTMVPASPYIKAFDVFALSSVNEGSPWVLLEAMAAGLPIVSTDVAGIPEIVKDGQNGFLVPPHSPEALAEKILEVLEKPELAERFSTNNQKDIQNFTVEKMVAKFEELY